MHSNTQKRIFTLLEKYIEPHKDPEKPYKIKRIHNNYEACKNCKA